ncbi:MAG: hypothetical protein IPH27_12160 [Actinomycetales bacterium]|jgi:hypothetical protein|nr:hypothetical protein [Candidatus Phosphoribacter baldrii]
MTTALASWSRRRWLAALGAAVVTGLVIGVPTALIPTPVFGREVPPTAWSWPVLVVTSVLSGLLFATYVREPGAAGAGAARAEGAGAAAPAAEGTRAAGIGGLLSFLAVGCPVCNKIALLALGYSGALQWFAPLQPVLALAGVALLAWALRARLRGAVTCPVPVS